MRVVTLLFVLFSTSGFAQTRFIVEFQDSTLDCKESISQIENHLPDTYDRQFDKASISFSTLVNYELSFIDSILAICNFPDRIVSMDKTVFNSAEKAGGTNCEQAMQLCNSSAVPGNSSGFGIQELPNNNSIDGCLTVEHQSSWYYLNIQAAGSLVMRINPDDNDDDYDFALWGPFTAVNVGLNCPPITSPVRCSYSGEDGNTGMMVGAGDNSEPSGGNGWIEALPVLANQVYIMLIDNFSTSSDGYNINFNWTGNTTTATIGCTPVVLPVEISSFEGQKIGDENKLFWVTESEVNNHHFIVETTTNPASGNWEFVANVPGAGNSADKIEYSTGHYAFTNDAINYYRLTQVDNDGAKRIYNSLTVIDNRITDKKIAKTINLLGQEVSEDESGILILIFEDGSQEKRFNH